MKKYLVMFGAAGLLAAMMMFSGCGGGGDDYIIPIPVTTTTTVPGATTTTTTVAGGTTTTTVTGATTTTTTTIPNKSVSASGSDTAVAGMTYTFAKGVYEYTIYGFAAGNKMYFPAGNVFSGEQTKWDDGKYIVKSSDPAAQQTVTVTLFGLTPPQDGAQLKNDPMALNTTVAPNTIQ